MEFRITGKVITGNRIGRTLGFPTANITLGEEVDIPDGVYRARVLFDGKAYDAIASIGYRPTVGNDLPRRLEAHIFDFDGDIYGHEITVELLDHIRPELKFASTEELRKQITEDIKNVKNIIK